MAHRILKAELNENEFTFPIQIQKTCDAKEKLKY